MLPPSRRGAITFCGAFAALIAAAGLIVVSPATAKPCQYHQGAAKKACVKQLTRDRLEFPPAPVTWPEVARRVPDYQGFLRIGRCEQPGSGYAGINWTVAGPTYEGGLGFYHATWDGWRPAHYPGNAGWASPQQQVLVADAVRDSVGITAWGCSGAF